MLNRPPLQADDPSVDASAYALVHGVRRTRGALAKLRARPWPALRRWISGSLLAAMLLMVAIWAIAGLAPAAPGSTIPTEPPFATGAATDVVRILQRNLLVLALHAMACVAGFIAGSSLPLQARHHRGLARLVHERGRPVAMAFVVCATGSSLTWQAYTLGTGLADVASAAHTAPGILILGLLPHALPELVALFLPLAAWIVASRRNEWDRLLAATMVTVALALPVLVVAAMWEVYVAPHVLHALLA